MRGETSKQAELFSYVSLESRIPADHPIRNIRKATVDINRQVFKTSRRINPMKKLGNIYQAIDIWISVSSLWD